MPRIVTFIYSVLHTSKETQEMANHLHEIVEHLSEKRF